jgi:hypothetical protein
LISVIPTGSQTAEKIAEVASLTAEELGVE